MIEKEISLLPHNEIAFEKLKNSLRDHQMVAINHATGTGKSFILLKYLYQNRNKKILFLAPTYPIIYQFLEDHTKELGINQEEFLQLDTGIYSNFRKFNIEEVSDTYDIFVLDEYHRCGAKEWGKTINKLLEILKEKYPNKKVIGTTATEIRYLDNEKNMNHILFDGYCASRLSLADAILQGILPAPTYIHFGLDYLQRLEKIERKIQKNAFYQKDKLKYQTLIKDIKMYISEHIHKEKLDLKKYLNSNQGKYLSFSSTIHNIKNDSIQIKKLLDTNNIISYEVHSGQKQEKNRKILNEFKEATLNENYHILYSVNILNEGLHVKDIDAIFMLRETKSPIIYFQQLGRLLSYSRRKDNLYVFDLAGNLKNHPVIYQLYIEITKKAEELILLDPENKERYETILKRFQIIDTSTIIYEKLDKLKAITTNEILLKNRLETAIEILEGKVETDYVEELQAQIDIFKYQNYLDKDKFMRIKKLDIPKPNIFDLTLEQFDLYMEYLSQMKTLNNRENLLKINEANLGKEYQISKKNNRYLFKENFEKTIQLCKKELKEINDPKKFFKQLELELIKFVEENSNYPKYYVFTTKNSEKERELFCKLIFFYKELEAQGTIEKLNQIIEDNIQKKLQLKKDFIISKINEFVEQNEGYFPNSKAENSNEAFLAKEFFKIKKNFQPSDWKQLEDSIQKNQRIQDEIVSKYAAFIHQKKRYPLLNSNNQEEQKLAKAFLYFEETLTSTQKETIRIEKNCIRKKELLKNTYLEFKNSKK